MPDLDPDKLVIIGDDNWVDHLDPTDDDGNLLHKGLVPRSWQTHPQGCYATLPAMPDEPLIPEGEWQSRLDAQTKDGSALFDTSHAMPILDQDGYGYCWAHSSTNAVMITRALEGLPYIPLSAFMVAAIIKGGRDEGGWGAESMHFIAANGIATQAEWPQGTSSLRYDTPSMRTDAKNRIVTKWWDGSDNKSTATKQMIVSLLLGKPCVVDFDWWSHSVCAVRLVSLSPLTIDIKNSWKDWGDNGIGRLTGSKAAPDGVIIPRVAA